VRSRETLAVFLLAAKNRGIEFTTDQASGAWPNETRVRKAIYRAGDAHPIGSLATVIGSLGPHPTRLAVGPFPEGDVFGYFVFWDDPPGDTVPCFVTGNVLDLVPS